MWMGAGWGGGALSGRERHPIGRNLVIGAVGPTKPPAANQAAIDINRVRPFDGDWLLRRRRRSERIAERNHARIECATRGSERLGGLQHDRERREVGAADEDKGPAAPVKRH